MPQNPLVRALSQAIALAGLALAAAASAAPNESDAPAAPPGAAEHATAVPAAMLAAMVAKSTQAHPAVWTSETFGVEVQSARLSANGYVIDLRYRVLDAEKARPLLDRKVRPVLVDEASGDRFYVPQPPIVGALRQTSRNNALAAAGKTYFMIFANPDQRLKPGSTVALYIGDERFGNLRIEH